MAAAVLSVFPVEHQLSQFIDPSLCACEGYGHETNGEEGSGHVTIFKLSPCKNTDTFGDWKCATLYYPKVLTHWSYYPKGLTR